MPLGAASVPAMNRGLGAAGSAPSIGAGAAAILGAGADAVPATGGSCDSAPTCGGMAGAGVSGEVSICGQRDARRAIGAGGGEAFGRFSIDRRLGGALPGLDCRVGGLCLRVGGFGGFGGRGHVGRRRIPGPGRGCFDRVRHGGGCGGIVLRRVVRLGRGCFSGDHGHGGPLGQGRVQRNGRQNEDRHSQPDRETAQNSTTHRTLFRLSRPGPPRAR